MSTNTHWSPQQMIAEIARLHDQGRHSMTSHTEIPDAIVEKASRALMDALKAFAEGEPYIEQVGSKVILDGLFDLRAALSAVAPMLRAQGMREAAKCQPCTAEDPNETAYQRGKFDGIIEFGTAILARVEEIEGGKG